MKDPTEAEGGGPGHPFESSAAGPPPEGAESGKAMNIWGLRNSTPGVTPETVGRELDMAADWYEHLFCGFMKQSSSDGAEAWMHYVMAMILLADNELELALFEEAPSDDSDDNLFGDATRDDGGEGHAG